MRELRRVSYLDFNESLRVTTQRRDKNSRRIWVPTVSFKSYDHFIGFLADA